MARFPGAVWKPLPRNFNPGARAAQLGLILHVQAGNGELSGWFSNPSAQASSTFWVGKDGTVVQYMEAGTDKSWAQAGGNALYDSVETEGQPTEKLTDAQVTALARLVRWEHDTYGMPYTVINTPGARGFGWHGMGGTAWGGHTGCPGDLRRAQMPQILTLAQGTTPTQKEFLMTLTDKQQADLKAKIDSLWKWNGGGGSATEFWRIRQQLSQLQATTSAQAAAIKALAVGQGLDGEALTKAISDAVDKALADIEITLTTKEN